MVLASSASGGDGRSSLLPCHHVLPVQAQRHLTELALMLRQLDQPRPGGRASQRAGDLVRRRLWQPVPHSSPLKSMPHLPVLPTLGECLGRPQSAERKRTLLHTAQSELQHDAGFSGRPTGGSPGTKRNRLSSVRGGTSRNQSSGQATSGRPVFSPVTEMQASRCPPLLKRERKNLSGLMHAVPLRSYATWCTSCPGTLGPQSGCKSQLRYGMAGANVYLSLCMGRVKTHTPVQHVYDIYHIVAGLEYECDS